MKPIKIVLVVAAAVVLMAGASHAEVPVEVPLGKGTIINLEKESKRVSVSDPEVADLVLISPTEILVNGKKIGSTSLIVWDTSNERTFFDLYVVGDIGELRNHIDKITPGEDVIVEMANDTVILKGTLKKQASINKIVALSEAYATNVLNFLKLEEPQQVMLQVRVAQIDKNKLKEIGLDFLVKDEEGEGSVGHITFPDGSLGGATPGFDMLPGLEGFDFERLSPEIGVAHFDSGIAGFIRALVDNDIAKILAEPNLIVRSGEEGSFLAGTRVPVQEVTGVTGTQTVSITFEEVGVKINFSPEVMEDDRIRLKIDPAEVSNIARFVNFQGVIAPEIDTREVRTSVDLNEGESLILAGLLTEDMKKNLQKIPILGDIPILGAIFRATRDELERTELAFFITPRLVKAIPEGEEVELPGENSPTPEEERKMRWIPLPKFGSKDKGTEGGEYSAKMTEDMAPIEEMDAEGMSEEVQTEEVWEEIE